LDEISCERHVSFLRFLALLVILPPFFCVRNV
jgi:hypothetical protein